MTQVRTSTIVDVTPERTGLLPSLPTLTKARLSMLVLWTTAVGALLAASTQSTPLDTVTVLATMIGTALAAASASALNQLLEIPRDAAMKRTRTRPLPSGAVSPRSVLMLAVVCGVVGLAILALGAGWLPAFLAFTTIVLYAAVYTPLKPRTTLNTFIGAVCGAIPPMIGWAAVTGGLEAGAWALGGILFVWQLPHFLALAWLYRRDYERGGFVMLPVIDRSGRMTCRIVLLTSLMLVPLGLTVSMLGLAGIAYAIGSIVFAGVMIVPAIRLMRDRTNVNARWVFIASLVYLPSLLVLMVVD